jgi:transposase
MTTYGTVIPQARSIASWAWRTESLTARARHRLKILDWHRANGDNISLTARHFGLGRMTIWRWLKRFRATGIIGLNEYSRKPKRLRTPTTPWEVVSQTVELRRQYPAWSKYKLKVLLERQGVKTSVSTVGRILKRKNLINYKVSQKRKRAALRPKTRFPKGLRISHEGELVQIDVKHIMLVGGRRFYQFTAIDVLGKTRVLDVYPSESSRNGAEFLKECLKEFPFAIKTVQTDNGSTFLKEFDRLTKELGITHYFIYPRNPKQNTYVEISHEADQKEFYQQGNVCSDLGIMRQRIKERQRIWNEVRPHQALNYLTPVEYLVRLQTTILPTRNVIVLQT